MVLIKRFNKWLDKKGEESRRGDGSFIDSTIVGFAMLGVIAVPVLLFGVLPLFLFGIKWLLALAMFAFLVFGAWMLGSAMVFNRWFRSYRNDDES